MRFYTQYVIAMEHQVKQDGEIVDCNLSYIVALGPANEKIAIEFFEKTKNTSYTNIYGVENMAKVRAVYRRVYK